MKNVILHPEAKIEYLEAVSYLEYNREGYGAFFREAFSRLLSMISEHPEMFPKKRNGVQFCYMGMFRYNIVYLNREDDVVILAVAHTSRKPGYWKMRFLDAIKGVI